MIYQHVPRLDVSVADSLRVRVVESYQDLEDVSLDVGQRQLWPEVPEVRVFNVLKHKGRRPGAGVTNLVEQVNYKRTALKLIKDFYFSADFQLLHGLQDFHHYVLVGEQVDGTEDF